LVRLSKKNASISVLLGPSVEYVFGITQNYEYYLPGPQKGGTLYSFNYNELTGNILIILKFQKKKGSLSKPFPQHPPFFF
jgi:hypothetical protein